MKPWKTLIPLLGIIALSAAMGLTTPDNATAIPVADSDAAEIRGGGCGKYFTVGPVSCGAQIFCTDGQPSTCTTKQMQYMATPTNGDYVPGNKGRAVCTACSTRQFCTGVDYLASTKACITSTSATPVSAAP